MATQGIAGLFGPMMTQQQLDEQRALEFAKLDPTQQRSLLIGKGAAGVGRSLAGMFGVDVQDPQLKRANRLRQLASQFDINTPDGLRQMASAVQQEDPQASMELARMAQAMELEKAKLGSEQALTAQRMRERQAADPFQQFLRSAVGKVEPKSLAAYQKSGDPADLQWIKPEDKAQKSEFERILESLNLSPDEERNVRSQWVTAKLNPDPAGMKGLQAQIAQLTIAQKQGQLSEAETKRQEEKKNAVSKLSSAETNLDTAIATAERAAGLAPGSFAGATTQAIFSSIPWTDSKSLNNLVKSLNSEKTIQTLEELKSQSRTGATGFGALTEKELDLILAKTRALDPTDRMFRENLRIVVEGWKKIKQNVRSSRLNLQGRADTEDPLNIR